MVDPTTDGSADALGQTFDSLSLRQHDLLLGANSFSRAMTSVFAGAVTQGKQFDDVLKSLALRLSDLSVKMALQPVTRGVAGGLSQLSSGLFGGSGLGGTTAATNVTAAFGAIKPFAAGGVIGTPTYFPLSPGGVGLAGEARPEAIMPLTRGSP